LVHNPAGFFKEAMAEAKLGFAAIIAGVVIGRQHIKTIFIQPDSTLANILNQQIEDGDGTKGG
jgi:hypothetical protein